MKNDGEKMKAKSTDRERLDQNKADDFFMKIEDLFSEKLSAILAEDLNTNDRQVSFSDTLQDHVLCAFRDAVQGARNLSEVISICSKCKKIKMPGGEWVRIEQFFYEQKGTEISHGYCQECANEIIRHFKLND